MSDVYPKVIDCDVRMSNPFQHLERKARALTFICPTCSDIHLQVDIDGVMQTFVMNLDPDAAMRLGRALINPVCLQAEDMGKPFKG